MKYMKNRIMFAYCYFMAKVREKRVNHDKIRGYLKNRKLIADTRTQTAEEINLYIKNLILSGKPFLAM